MVTNTLTNSRMSDRRESQSAVWGNALSNAVEGVDEKKRVRALATLMSLADSRINKVPMWRDSAENGTRDVLLCAARADQPEKAPRC